MSDQNTITYRPASQDDLPAVIDLLGSLGLPLPGVEQYLDDFFVAEVGNRFVGCAGFEEHGAAGLVRSVAVVPQFRGQKIAEKLYGELVRVGRERGLREFALLTVNAQDYFARFGFKVVGRDEIDPDLLESDQFKNLCPSTAVCMRIALGCKPIGSQLGIGLKR